MRVRAACTTIGLLLVATCLSAAEPTKTPALWDVERLLATETPLVVDHKDGNLWAVRYPGRTLPGARHVRLRLLRGSRRGRTRPVRFRRCCLVHGGGGKAFAEWARLWAERGYVALAMDLAGNGPDGQRLADGGPPQDDGAKFYALETNKLPDTWPYQAVADVLRGHALLAARGEVDANRIGITGISWGGYLTCIVAGIDHRLKAAVPVYGCGFLGDNSSWREAGVFDKLSPAARRTWLAEFDPSQYLPGVQCPILFVNGTNDRHYQLDSYRKSYELVTAPRTLCVTVNMPHGHPAGWAPPEIGAFVDSLLKGGQPLANLGPLKIDGSTASADFKVSVPLKSACAALYARHRRVARAKVDDRARRRQHGHTRHLRPIAGRATAGGLSHRGGRTRPDGQHRPRRPRRHPTPRTSNNPSRHGPPRARPRRLAGRSDRIGRARELAARRRTGGHRGRVST